MVFVEGAPVLVHERVARPRLGNQHHRGVRQRIAAADQEFESIVEAGGVRLALIGDRPELGNVVAEKLRRDARLTRRHPVDVAAHGVDLAVVADHPVGVGEAPRREGVGREALVDERERGLDPRVGEVLVIGGELEGEEHPLVDHRPAGHRHDVEIVLQAAESRIDARRDDLADDVKLALEMIVVGHMGAAADEDLAMRRLAGDDLGRLGKTGIVDGHVAPAEERVAFLAHHFLDDLLHRRASRGVARHE